MPDKQRKREKECKTASQTPRSEAFEFFLPLFLSIQIHLNWQQHKLIFPSLVCFTHDGNWHATLPEAQGFPSYFLPHPVEEGE